MFVFGVGSLRSLAEAEALTRVELAVSAAREGLRQSTEDLLTAAGSSVSGPAPAASSRVDSRRATSVPRPLLRRRGARCLRHRAGWGADSEHEPGARLDCDSRGRLRTGRTVSCDRRGRWYGDRGRSCGRRRARGRHRVTIRRMDARSPTVQRARGPRGSRRRLCVVRAGRGAARNPEFGRAVARRARRSVRRGARLLCGELAGSGGDR